MSNLASLADLKAITAEHVKQIDTQGRIAVKGSNKRVLHSKDPFDKPSPGLVKRLAAEARNEASRRVFQDEAGPSDEQRRIIMLAKAEKYAAMKRGDFSGLTARELEEGVLDYDRWQDGDDADESADLPEILDDQLEQVEYVDEMGRTRTGTRREKQEAERLVDAEEGVQRNITIEREFDKVLQSNVIHGDQFVFPVYEPDPDALRAKLIAAQEEERSSHYDASKEVRARGAGHYQFSLDDAKRTEQMASLKADRLETERARGVKDNAAKRRLDERRALIEAKRRKVMGAGNVDKLREARQEAEAERFLRSMGKELEK